MNISEISKINRARADEWHEEGIEWSLADWSNAMQGEAGEAGNVVKKIRRIECGLPGNKPGDDNMPALKRKLKKECGDTFLYLDLLASFAGFSLEEAIIEVFNEKSIEVGLPHRLELWQRLV